MPPPIPPTMAAPKEVASSNKEGLKILLLYTSAIICHNNLSLPIPTPIAAQVKTLVCKMEITLIKRGKVSLLYAS